MTATDLNGLLFSAFNPAGTDITLNEAMYRWAISQGGIVNAMTYATPGVSINDGVTDATSTIQSAINAMYTAGGGIVYLPAGTYIVNGTGTASAGCLQLKSNVVLQGAGIDVTIIKVATGSTNSITGIVRTPSSTRTVNVALNDLTIDGNRNGAGNSGTVIGYYCGVSPSAAITSITRSTTVATATCAAGDRPAAASTVYIFQKENGTVPVEYLGQQTVTTTPLSTTFTFTVSGTPANVTEAIWFYNTTLTNAQCDNVSCNRVKIKDCSSYGFDPHEQTTNFRAIDCIATGNGTDGFVADYLSNGGFFRCISYSNDRHGFNLTTATHDFDVMSCTGYSNGAVSTGSDLVVQRGSDNFLWPRGIKIIGGSYRTATRNGILIQMGAEIVIVGAHLDENGFSGVRLLGAKDCIIGPNTLTNNSQTTTNTYSDVYLAEYDDSAGASATIYGSLRNKILSNTTRSLLTKKSKYSFEEVDDSSDYNVYADNMPSGATTGDYSIATNNLNTKYGYSVRGLRTYLTNHYYYPVATAGALSTKAMTAGRMYYVGPFTAENNVTFTKVGVRIGTGTGTPGDTAIIGVYTDSGGLPVALVGTNNAEAAIDAAADVEVTVSISLVAGRRYWMVINCEASVTLASYASTANVRDFSSNVAPDSVATIIKDTVAYAATLPATSAAAVGDYVAEAAPFIWLRVV